MRYRKHKKKVSALPCVLVLLGALALILAFVPMKAILIILAVFLILLGLCLCFGC